MQTNDLNSTQWKELKKSTNVSHSETNTDTRFFNNIKDLVREEDEDKIISWDFWKILKVAPFTYTKKFDTENQVIEDISLFKALKEYFISKGIEKTQQFQYPNQLLWYFTLENEVWHNIIQFEKIPKGETNNFQYNWCLINPKNFLNSLSEVDKQKILQRTLEILNELQWEKKLSKKVKKEKRVINKKIWKIL